MADLNGAQAHASCALFTISLSRPFFFQCRLPHHTRRFLGVTSLQYPVSTAA